MKAFCISALASNQGKTIFTTALLWHFRDSVRPFKIGPDFIDPQFHTQVCDTPSVNLDSFIMSEKQVAWMFTHYADKKVAVLEGVMGFYDGDNKGCSAYSVSKLLQVPTILILDGSGSYITISAVLGGLLNYKKGNTIQAVVLNKLSSAMHYALIKKQIEEDHPHIVVLGWIEKNLPALSDTHLGLDLKDLDKIAKISKDVLKHIDINKLSTLSMKNIQVPSAYPFTPIPTIDKKLVIVNDSNFSFLYHDNLLFLREVFKEVVLINATKNERIPIDSDAVYLPGGYVETEDSYKKIKDATQFKQSLIAHAKEKAIYAECTGLLYLSKSVDEKVMAGVLDIHFTLENRFNRLGYYYNEAGIKGHAFHYTKPTESSLAKGFDILSKTSQGKGLVGSWRKDKVLGTYLHTMFRNNTQILNHFIG